MYVTPGRFVGGAMAGGAGATAVSPDGLARTGTSITLLLVIGLVLVIGGFLLLRARLQAAGDAA